MKESLKSTWSSPVRFAIGVGLTLCLLAPAKAESLLTTNGKFFAWPDTQVPGTPGVYFGGNVDFSTLDENGSLAFRADLYGAGTSGINGKALFTGASVATLSMLARWNDPAPGLPGLSLINVAGSQGIHYPVSISPSGGYKIWSSWLSGPGVGTTNDSALFLSSPGGHSLIAREGAPAPGTAGAVYFGNKQADYQFAKINRNGTVLFYSQLAGGDVVVGQNDYAFFTGTPGAVSMFLREGDTVLPGPVTVGDLGVIMQLDNNGRVLYNLYLEGVGVTDANNESFWFYTPGSGSQLLVREGDPAPGTAGATFVNTYYAPLHISPASLTRSGRYEFTTGLVGGDVVAGSNDRALYAGMVGGGLNLIARSGQPAPGTDALFSGFHTSYSLINDAGDVAFQGILTGGTTNPTNNSGIWIWRSGTLSLVVRGGDSVPVAPPGLNTPGIAPGTFYEPFAGWNMMFNDLGQIVVVANLIRGEVNYILDTKLLLAWDPVKGLFNLARSGEDVEGAPGSIRTTRLFSTNQFNNSDGVSLSLSKTGMFGITVYLNDGTAVATVDLNCYPSTAYGSDADGDGRGAIASRVNVCSGATPPAGFVPNATDCNDQNASVYATYYRDADGDGYGIPGVSICDDATPPPGYSVKKTDCNDAVAAYHPGALDAICDAIDENCNGIADEDFVTHPSTCGGLGACAGTGIAECIDNILHDSCVPGTPSVETCNGIDDNCDGTVDNAAAPTGTPAVVLQKFGTGAALVSWQQVDFATGYDMVRGGLQTLRSTGGDFTTSTTNCLENNLQATSSGQNPFPTAGQGYWYLLRAVSCGGNASYNSGSPKQLGSRDAEIAASGLACP